MVTKNIKIWCKSVILMTLVALLIVPNAFGGKVQLPEGTEVKVRFDPEMKVSSGKLMKGIPLLIYLAEPIMIGGKTIVEEGSQGKAEVLEVREASKPGKPGYIKVGFVEIEPKGEYSTLDESNIKLSGEAEAEGKGKKLLSYLLIFGLFIKGGQAELPVDQVYTAKIKETIIMQSE